MTPPAPDFVAKMADFAREHVRGHPGLDHADAFPMDLWRGMGREGLLGFSLPKTFGGLGAALREQLAAAEALVRYGRSLGFALSWQSHNTLSRFLIAGFGSAEQQARWLPELAAGRITPAVAISELGAGAHPKHLKMRAERRGEDWLLNGEKAYLTNGPIADIFVVVAVSAVADGRKRFSAFLVPKDSPGLALTDAGTVDYLRPSMHCGLRLTDCPVPAEGLLGAEGDAYDSIARPLRSVEDMMMLGIVAGGMLAEIDLLAEAVARQGAAVSDEARERLGGMAATVPALRTLAVQIVDLADDEAGMTPLLLATRRLVRQFQADTADLQGLLRLAPDPELDRFSRDLAKLGGIARYVEQARLKMLGEAALAGVI